MNKAKLSYDERIYFPDLLMISLSEKEMRDEYTRLRDIGQKRIKRLGKSQFADSQTYQKWKEGIPKLKDLPTKSDIAHALTDLASFIQSPFSSITGHKSMQEKQIETLKEHYIPKPKTEEDNKIPISPLQSAMHDMVKNLQPGKKYDAFTSFMNRETELKLEKIFGSNRAMILFSVLEKKGIKNINPVLKSPKSMAYWMYNVENLEALTLPEGKTPTVGAYKKLIESEIDHGRDRKSVTIQAAEDIIAGKRKSSKRSRNGKRSGKRSGKRT